MSSLFRARSPLLLLPAGTNPTTDTLSNALKSFQDRLDPEQKAKLEAIKAVPDAHAVAEFTHQLDQENARRKSRCVAARISPLLESIQQFSGVVETFVSSHPQVAALVWGSIKLVLQIASNFTTYFDKLSALLMTIGKRCPRFQEYQKLYGGSTDLQKALCNFYSVIVRCCEQAIVALRRPGYAQLLKAVTGNFNSEFEPILTQIEISSDEVNETIRLVEAKLSATERQDQRSERHEAQKSRLEVVLHRKERSAQRQLERRRIRQATKLEQVSSFNNKIAYWKARIQRHGSTGQWLTLTDQFMQWIAGSNSSVFWCTGNLGSGKTVMTGYVVESLSAKFGQSTEKLVYFFCQYDNETSLQATTVLQSIIRQLLDQDDSTFVANEHGIEALLNNPHDLSSLEVLLSDVIDSLKSIVVVLDGIDECSLTEMRLLLKTFRSIMLRQPSGLKLYLAGDDRISDLVRSFLKPDFVVSTQRSEAGSDLKELVQQLVDTRKDDGNLVVGDPDLYQEIVDLLCTASQGMILWVKFQLEELCSQKTDESIRLALEHLPKDIFEIYNRLLSRISEEGSAEMCTKIFRHLAAAKRPLTLNELGEALSIQPCQPQFMPDRLVNDTKAIVRWCHGLIALHDLDNTLQFAHLSVKDFFCSPETNLVTLSGFHFRQDEANRSLGEVCVTYLSFSDFKTQLVKSPKPQTFLEPMMIASHALSAGSPGIVSDKAKAYMKKRSMSNSTTSKLLLPQAIHRANHVATRDWQFLQYASQFWLLHTAEFSPEQGRLWRLFQLLAKERFPVLVDGNKQALLQAHDERVTALRDYLFPHQHQALFREYIVRFWHKQDRASILALIFRFKCFSFVSQLRPLAELPQSSWLESLFSLRRHDVIDAIGRVGTEWIEGLALNERSYLLWMLVGTNSTNLPSIRWALVKLGIDPYFEWSTFGKRTTLLEELIRDPDDSLLSTVCDSMLASGADFERKITATGRTALHVASDFRMRKAMVILLKCGAFVNATDNHGQTALHLTAIYYELAYMEVLLEAGASLDLKDKSGKVALDYLTDDVKEQVIEAAHRRTR